MKKSKTARIRRAFRVRKKMKNRKRLSFHKSNKNLYAQVIDDEQSKTLFGIGTLSKQNKQNKMKLKEAAKLLGSQIAKKSLENGIKKVCFDRGRFKYHGIVKEFAQAARDGGLEF